MIHLHESLRFKQFISRSVIHLHESLRFKQFITKSVLHRHESLRFKQFIATSVIHHHENLRFKLYSLEGWFFVCPLLYKEIFADISVGMFADILLNVSSH